MFEGEIINSTGFGETMQVSYELKPYKIFKGKIQKDSFLKIMDSPISNNATANLGGEWSHEKDEVGIFFVKRDSQNNRLYRFVNSKNA